MKIAVTCLCALVLIAGTRCDAPAVQTNRVIIRPTDTGEALVNPGMGWTLHFYSNFIENYGSKLEPSDTLDDWPGMSVIFLRVPWGFLEPKEGEFNWSLFDTPAQRWIAKGKQIAICVSSCESWWRDAVPKWVQDAGAKGIEFDEGIGPTPGGRLWEPDYLDPIFLQKLENFLAAMARRYDGNPNVAFIVVGSFGMWGEGHTVFSSKLSEEKTLEYVKKHIDIYTKHFKQTQLCISDDVAGATKPGTNFPATDYALSKGVTLRDDSILVSQKKPWFHAEMAQSFWPTMPVILEHEHYGAIKARKKWDGNTLFEAIEAYHASYMS
ncbi:MAG: beta-galactosidase, partial [Verrucomicrobia bacterium]|nr:beta-galactosidase [Verrucomicrobiota bacterium]